MNRWSHKSESALLTCDGRIVEICNRALHVMDCTIICGFRNAEAQTEAFRTGHSTKQWGESKHNFRETHPMHMRKPGDPAVIPWSLAVDVAPYPIDWTDRYRFAHFAGIMIGIAAELGTALVWGGNWDGGDLEKQKFDDLVHFELSE